MKTNVTLRQIADEVGVSVMTVSRALRKAPKVSPKLSAAILRKAEELGYRPNPLVSALMASRRSRKSAPSGLKIAFVTNHPTFDGWRKLRILREYFEGAARTADQYGYQLEEFWLAEKGMTSARMSQLLWTRNIPGLIMAPLPLSQGSIQLRWENFAAVALGYSIADPQLDRSCHHHFRAMLQLMTRLHALGYRRPGFVMPADIDERVLHAWYGGFLVQQQFLRVQKVVPFLPARADWTAERFGTWLNRNRPDVVIAEGEETLGWLRKSNHRVPEEIGFADVDCASSKSNTTGIFANGHGIGVAAAELLLAKLNRNERGLPAQPRTILIEGAWVNGKTTLAKAA